MVGLRGGRRAVVALLAMSAVAVPAATAPEAGASGTSVSDAYTFLNQQMDLYASGSTPRLAESFTGGTLGAQGFTDSETYDDALMIDAYLAEGTTDGLTRAEVLGNSLLLVQAHDPSRDGRIRAAYAPTPLVRATRRRQVVRVRIRDHSSDVGNMAWVGMALARLYADTGDVSYLGGAESIGTWVVDHCYDQRGAGGFTGGLTPRGRSITWKSTEHNIDLYGLFTMLATETGNSTWSTDASWARGSSRPCGTPARGPSPWGRSTTG